MKLDLIYLSLFLLFYAVVSLFFFFQKEMSDIISTFQESVTTHSFVSQIAHDYTRQDENYTLDLAKPYKSLWSLIYVQKKVSGHEKEALSMKLSCWKGYHPFNVFNVLITVNRAISRVLEKYESLGHLYDGVLSPAVANIHVLKITFATMLGYILTW